MIFLRKSERSCRILYVYVVVEKKTFKIFSEHCTTFKDKIHLGGLNLSVDLCTFFDKHSKVSFSEIRVRT